MRDAERTHERLLLEVREAFFQVGVDRERETGFGDFRIFAGLERQRSGFRRFGIFARIFQMIARRHVALARAVQAKGGDEVGEAVYEKNALDAGAVVEKTDE